MTDSNIRSRVCDAYSGAADAPEGTHPFPVGKSFGEALGYDPRQLAELPASATAAFTGVSNLDSLARIAPGDTVLDLGCGAGTDSLLAARRTGADGRVVGLDFSPRMLHRARSAAATAGATNIGFAQAAAEQLPLADRSIDVALINGLFNLNPRRQRIFAELSRVLRPGGTAWVAELILDGPRPAARPGSDDDWFA